MSWKEAQESPVGMLETGPSLLCAEVTGVCTYLYIYLHLRHFAYLQKMMLNLKNRRNRMRSITQYHLPKLKICVKEDAYNMPKWSKMKNKITTKTENLPSAHCKAPKYMDSGSCHY